MSLYDLAKDIHANAVEHGWWEDERPDYEIRALTHSEWSEALEEARSGRPMVWYACMEGKGHPCEPKDEEECLNYGHESTCKYRCKKPEGIAVELIDGCIRVLDWLGWWASRGCGWLEGLHLPYPDDYDGRNLKDVTIADIVDKLHRLTCSIGNGITVCNWTSCETEIMALVFYWLTAHDIDPYEILRIKHEYNKGRPYKHGKEF